MVPLTSGTQAGVSRCMYSRSCSAIIRLLSLNGFKLTHYRLDEALAVQGMQRRVAPTLPYVMVMPAVLEQSDLLARTRAAWLRSMITACLAAI